jgi:hypothetical protein
MKGFASSLAWKRWRWNCESDSPPGKAASKRRRDSMYSWDEDTSSWYGKSSYSYSSRGASARGAAAAEARASGPRTYEKKSQPNEKIIDPSKHIK